MKIIGIDPGLDGALALLQDGEYPRLGDVPTLTVGKKRDYNIPLMRQQLVNIMEPGCVAVVESVHSMPKQGVSSSFSFGKGFGIWLGLLAGLQIPYDLVPPERWKKVLMDGMAKDKDASRLRALQLFPAMANELNLKRHHGRADALLLAEYRRRLG